MNLTDELMEMWQQEAERGCLDISAANARIIHLCHEVTQMTNACARLVLALQEHAPHALPEVLDAEQ